MTPADCRVRQVGIPMKINGEFEVPSNAGKIWDMLDDPLVIKKLIPHLHEMREVADGRYEATIKVGMGPIRGEFSGEITVLSKSRPENYRLGLKGKGPTGWVQGEGLITLSAIDEDSTRAVVSGDAQVGGLIARVGQRFILSAARSLMRDFFKNISAQVGNA